MSRTFFPPTLEVLQKNLDLRMARHQVLTSNVANAETPGYIAKDVSFEAALRDAVQTPPPPKPPPAQPNKKARGWAGRGGMEGGPVTHPTPQRTHPQHLPVVARSVAEVQGVLIASPSDNVGRDLNTVSLDQEMGRLTLNAFHYNTSIEFLGRSLDQLRRVISA